jgi:hypothetical protein
MVASPSFQMGSDHGEIDYKKIHSPIGLNADD